MYITVCYDKAQTMLGLFIYFKYLLTYSGLH